MKTLAASTRPVVDARSDAPLKPSALTAPLLPLPLPPLPEPLEADAVLLAAPAPEVVLTALLCANVVIEEELSV